MSLHTEIKQRAQIVIDTMGPNGKKVLFTDQKPTSRKNGNPYFKSIITRDGVTVVDSLLSKHDDNATKLIYDVANSTVDKVGDGTTLSVLLFSHFIDGVTLEEVELACKLIDEKKVTPTKEQLISVAVSSCNNDVPLGTMIGNLIWELGEDAYITTEFGEQGTEIKKGLNLPGGCLPTFEGTYEEPNVLVIETALKMSDEVMPIFEIQKVLNPECYQGDKLVKTPRPLIVISSLVQENARRTIANNKAFNVILTNMGHPNRDEVVFELGHALGCTPVTPLTKTQGTGAQKKIVITPDNIGKAQRVTVNTKEAMIVFNQGAETENKERKAAYSKGTGIIRIAPQSDIHMEALLFRVEDSARATNTAFKGVVPGAGKTTLEISKHFKGAMKEALEAPSKLLPDGDVFDSAEVIKTAIRTAASVAIEVMDVKHII